MKNLENQDAFWHNVRIFLKEFIIVMLVTLLALAIQREVWPNEVSVKIERVDDTEYINVTICKENSTKVLE